MNDRRLKSVRVAVEDEMHKIDCLIISVGRAASTAVYRYLNEACKLDLPKNKEPHHWCDVRAYKGRSKLLNDIYVESSNEYYELYSESKLSVDASVGYFFCISEVIENLKNVRQKPKVVFLYREPVTRAYSLFNELRKKGLTVTSTVFDEIQGEKGDGLWWENYFDNVLYIDTYKKMESYFDQIMVVNYKAFESNPLYVISCIARFLGVQILSEIDLVPVNSSAEANIISSIYRNRIIMLLVGMLPVKFKRYVKTQLIRLLHQKRKRVDEGLLKYLSNSIDQYNEFRKYIHHKDIFVREFHFLS